MSGISIHALLAESDSKPRALKSRRCVFLSTLSLRRATKLFMPSQKLLKNFYPRSPCGERHNINSSVNTADKISIHALLAESDFASAGWLEVIHYFYPRSPCGERLHLFASSGVDFAISIHALLAESDSKSAQNSGALLRI